MKLHSCCKPGNNRGSTTNTESGPRPRPRFAGSERESCHPPQGNNLNLILLGSDTFRADNLAGYGSQWIECPNLNRFAHVVSGYGWIACVRDQQWNFSEVWNPTAYRGNYPPQLYDVESDRQELTNARNQETLPSSPHIR